MGFAGNHVKGSIFQQEIRENVVGETEQLQSREQEVSTEIIALRSV